MAQKKRPLRYLDATHRVSGRQTPVSPSALQKERPDQSAFLRSAARRSTIQAERTVSVTGPRKAIVSGRQSATIPTRR